jgi:hypothetical protein
MTEFYLAFHIALLWSVTKPNVKNFTYDNYNMFTVQVLVSTQSLKKLQVLYLV